ncbi:zona pellucida-like domain-containing protein 1 [Scleropages formosus]|uniref:zona pellucida-like domain-containing protein 1 n=1 Tax=Scleropages formosus TaxID=113540 RepID=UPI0010FAAF6C|nr:zona pellucida-like domain-containing protein 1 [Scleropages formosus]
MNDYKMHTMHFLISLIFALVLFKSCQSLNSTDCGQYYRRPEYTDISVDCGTTTINLAVIACPVIYTGYNESLLKLNSMTDPTCGGTLDVTVMPAVVRFQFPLNATNSCGSTFTTTSAAGTGIFSDFSNIQTVNISGVIRSNDPTTGMVTYNADLKYFYSCSYPLEYLINNTRVDVSASSIAVKDNNGSFISTLSLQLYADQNYTSPLTMPPLGLELRTKVYVQVKATNLTSQYFVLLDRCYAAVSLYPTNSSYFNLFVSCSRDQLTTMLENGQSQNARFSFPAFRFIEQQNQTVSTYYLHCITRLCEQTTCKQFQSCSSTSRRRRDVSPTPPPGLTDTTTVTSPPIRTKTESIISSKEELSSKGEASGTSTGLGVAVGILVLACIGMIAVGAIFYRRLNLHPGNSKSYQG